MNAVDNFINVYETIQREYPSSLTTGQLASCILSEIIIHSEQMLASDLNEDAVLGGVKFLIQLVVALDELAERGITLEKINEPQNVRIDVQGGVAEVVKCPDNVKVQIVDWDRPENGYCPFCDSVLDAGEDMILFCTQCDWREE